MRAAFSPGSVKADARKGVITMIDWNSDDWGNQVHLCGNGSWVPDRHADEPED